MPAALLVLLLCAVGVSAGESVSIRGSLDGASQPALISIPEGPGPFPLLVHLHSWSATFDKSSDLQVAIDEAKQRQWAFISPDFRGPNDKPAACGSELAVQDVLDAVQYMRKRTKIDDHRIYLLGSSGGGYMTLVMAGRAPDLWAAASAWVPITDLAAWYDFSKKTDSRYWKMLEGCFGSGPGGGLATQQYRRRSPLFFLQAARGLPIDINTGIQDGHTGSVPVSHSLRAFNVLVQPGEQIAAADIAEMTKEAKVPDRLKADIQEERKRPILFRRESETARVTIFDGGHEGDFPTAIRWLEEHTRPAWTLGLSLQESQVLQRDAQGTAKPLVPEAPGLESRVNNGPWKEGAPTLSTGGPYTIEFRSGGATARRKNVFVGDLYILAGQSNMVGRAPLEGATSPNQRVRVLTPQDIWDSAREPLHEAKRRPDGVEVGAGLGLPFAKELVRRTNVPVGVIPCAVGGTSLEQWNPIHATSDFRRSLYGNCIARAKLAGGRFKGLLWYQGENDAAKMETASTYDARFAAFIARFRADLGQEDLPVYYAQLSRYVVESGYEGWNVVQEAQRVSEKLIAKAAMVATIDLTLTDPIHLDRRSLERLGKRFATRVLSEAGPSLVSATWDRSDRIRLKFTQRLKPSGQRIHGFEITGGMVFHTEQDAETGDVLLSVVKAKRSTETVKLYYGRGLNPVCNLTDARDLALPVFGPVEVGQ